ncbi:hypothetical protein BT96DRAFT_913435 [Gymnopus androsaceus JB14]|uniref:Uncharacterized protein n=1 Tax=Gymnopus androsaceus JB14 TaxID=1447944 RepID=A0A6A4IL93_9AGAR|nr:hypothetical protein BT96DRAFT_913435 [Gymnopus androsaceus JB14]
MPKAAADSSSKAATKKANDKTTKAPKEKGKRAPTAYNLFCAANMKNWNEANPGKPKECMKAMSEMWKKAPENPKNSGGATTKKSKVPKATASSSPASSSQPTVDDTKENDVPSSDVDIDIA